MTMAAEPHISVAGVAALTKLSPEVLEPMVKLFREGQAPHHARFPRLFGASVERRDIAAYLGGFFKPRNPFRRQSGFALGWYADGALSGYLLYRLQRRHYPFYGKVRWTCFVEDIVVAERARGQGGGSALMEALLAQVEALPDCAISGVVWQGNEASQGLFAKHGFSPLSQTYYKVTPCD